MVDLGPPALPQAKAPWPLPQPQHWQAPSAWTCIEFVSDVHLAEQLPRTLQAFEAYLAGTNADAVFILGDLFELWPGDDAMALPFQTRCVRALQSAGRRLSLHLMHGNRDFLIGQALLEACNAKPVADPTVLEAFGQRMMLSHGDGLCLEDTSYQSFRLQVRSAPWQAACLAQPLQERLALAARIRKASQANHEQRRFDGMMGGDISIAPTSQWLAAHGCPVLMHGHTHQPSSGPLQAGLAHSATRHVLSDWDLDCPAPRADVLRWTATGIERLSPADA